MTIKTLHQVVLKHNHGHVIFSHHDKAEADAYMTFTHLAENYDQIVKQVLMHEPMTGDYHLPRPVRDQIAEWLVRNGGERCDFLDAYDGELQEGIHQHWFEREDVEYVPANAPTTKDLNYITALVSKATVTVHLPYVDEDAVDSEPAANYEVHFRGLEVTA